MNPWSKVEYSRLIREALMVVEKLPEVNPPSGTVSGQGLLATLILESRWRQNRGEIMKKGSVLEVSRRGGNIGEGGIQRWTRGPRRPPGMAKCGAAQPGH